MVKTTEGTLLNFGLAGAYNLYTSDFKGAYIGIVRKSSDQGATWKNVFKFGQGSFVSDAIASSSGTVYALVETEVRKTMSVFASYDQGVTWKNVDSVNCTSINIFRTITEYQGKIIFGGNCDGYFMVRESVNDGNSWNTTSSFYDASGLLWRSSGAGPKLVISSTGDYLVANVKGEIFRKKSTDQNWIQLQTNEPQFSAFEINGLMIDKNDWIYCYGYGFLRISKDMGDNWQTLREGQIQVEGLSPLAFEFANMVAGRLGIYASVFTKIKNTGHFEDWAMDIYLLPNQSDTWKVLSSNHLSKLSDRFYLESLVIDNNDNFIGTGAIDYYNREVNPAKLVTIWYK